MVQDTRIELWLAEKTVPYRYDEAIHLEQIHLERSKKNNARFGEPIKRDLVETYKIAIQDGSQLPAVILYQDGDWYVVISGNHRVLAALEAGKKTIDAYVVSTHDSTTVDILTHTANTIEGVRDSRADAIQHAVILNETYGFRIKDAAAMCKVPESAVKAAHQERAARVRMDQLQIEPTQFHPSTRTRLGAIGNDTALRAAATLTKEARIGGAMLDELVSAVNQERTEAAQLGVIQQWETRPDILSRLVNQERGRRPIKATRDDTLLSKMQTLFGHMQRTTPGTHPPEHLQMVMVDTWKRLRSLLDEYLVVEQKDGAAVEASPDGALTGATR